MPAAEAYPSSVRGLPTSAPSAGSGLSAPSAALVIRRVVCRVASPRLPLPCLRWRRSAGGQFGISQALADHATGEPKEAFAFSGLAMVEAEGFLIQVTEQVERFDADVRALDRSLQERPEILDPVGVNPAIDVLLSVVDNASDVLTLKAVVGPIGVADNLCALRTLARTLPVSVPFIVFARTLARRYCGRLAHGAPRAL